MSLFSITHDHCCAAICTECVCVCVCACVCVRACVTQILHSCKCRRITLQDSLCVANSLTCGGVASRDVAGAIMDINELFLLADEAKLQSRMDEGEDACNDIDENNDAFKVMYANARGRVRTGKTTCTVLPDGDVHVCYGMQCPHTEVTKEKQIVCTLTCRVVGVEHSRDQEAGWTGRSVGSANPDDTAGTPIGGWIKRRDMFNASSQAWQMARSFGEADQASSKPYTPLPTRPDKPTERVPTKRGALCVDVGIAAADGEQTSSPPSHRRQRVGRRETWTRDAVDKLIMEAHSQVINKLFIIDDEIPTATSEPEARDPRLENLEFVRTLALRRYVNACVKGLQRLNLNVLNDVCIHANAFVRARRAEASSEASAATDSSKDKRRGACYQGPVRNLIARLIVGLWHAACLTPHMKHNRKGNDSFRPFAAGVLYSLKRGVYLENGTCVVPELETLATHLPALRSTQSTQAARQLQSSSHRGICSLHRSITSIAEMEPDEAAQVRQLLMDAARQAALLREMVVRFDSGAERGV